MRMLMLAAALLVAGPVAAATTITFDPYTPVNSQLTSTVSIDGLDFTHAFAQYVWTDGRPNANNGTNALIYGYNTQTITQTGGGAFNLGSFEAGQSFYVGSTGSISYTLNLAAGGSINGTLNLTDSFQLFTFNQNVNSVVLGTNGGYVALDNIVFGAGGAVPEPATWAMLIVGFGMVGATMRRRRPLTA